MQIGHNLALMKTLPGGVGLALSPALPWQSLVAVRVDIHVTNRAQRHARLMRPTISCWGSSF